MVMTDLSNTELRRLDLTLLLVFLGLVRHRKAAKVADELGLTQSAISQALKRLREIFSDELFLRRPHGLEPTTLAISLERPVAQAVETLRSALGSTQVFNPRVAEGTVKIAALDAEQAVIVPALSTILRKTAPSLRISVSPIDRSSVADALNDGKADLFIGVLWDTPKSLSSELLFEESFLVAGTTAALPKAPQLTLNDYIKADHILVSPAGDLSGVVDDILSKLGKHRNVVLGLPAFLPALAASARSKAIVTLPSQIARTFARGFGLVTANPPIEIRKFRISIFWHKRNDNDPKMMWLRKQIKIAVQSPKVAVR